MAKFGTETEDVTLAGIDRLAHFLEEGVVGGLSHRGAEGPPGRDVGKRSVTDDNVKFIGIPTVADATDIDTFCFANLFMGCGGFFDQGKEVGSLAGLYAIMGDGGKRGRGTVRSGIPARIVLVSDDLGGKVTVGVAEPGEPFLARTLVALLGKPVGSFSLSMPDKGNMETNVGSPVRLVQQRRGKGALLAL